MAILLILIVLLLLLILWLLLRGRSARPGPAGPPSPGPGPQPSIPDHIPGAGIASYLAARLVGTPADGFTPQGAAPGTVVWVNSGDELLVHLDSVKTQIVNDCVLVSIDFETDQTGRTPLVVVFSLGQDAKGGLIATTDELPRGNGLLAARWGLIVQQAAWTALLSLASDHAAERGQSPRGFSVQNESLQIYAGSPLKLA